MDFLKYVHLHSERAESEAEDCAVAGSPELFWGQVVDENIGSEIENVKEQRLFQSKTKKTAEGFHNREVFHRDEVLKCSVLKELKLTVEKMIRSEAVREKAMSYDNA